MKSRISLRTLLTAATLALLGISTSTAYTTYHYDGDAVPTAGAYGTLFTTAGAGAFGSFPTTSWSSNGTVLTMNTRPSNGIWFGHQTPNIDPTSTLSLADTASGNWARASLALSPGATEWSFYFYDTSGFGAAFYLLNNGFRYYYKSTPGGANESIFQPVADMTQFHTFTSYVIAGQASYFFDNTYLGGGYALTGTTNALLLGDGSGGTPTGAGTMYVDYLTFISAVGDTPPTSVPEPAAYTVLAGLAVLGLALTSRRRAAAGRS